MFNTSQIQKFLSYFTTPYLDYRANKKSLLLRKWPFYVERDRKKLATYSLYGTLFTSSRWSAASSLNVSNNTNVVQEAVAEQPNSLFFSFILSPLNLINLFTSRQLSLLLIITYFTLLKLGITFTLPKTLFIIDPDLIYELYVAQHLICLHAFYLFTRLFLFFEVTTVALKYKLSGVEPSRLPFSAKGFSYSQTLWKRVRGSSVKAVQVSTPEKTTLLGGDTNLRPVSTKRSTLTVDELLYSALLSTSYYLQSIQLSVAELIILGKGAKLGFLGLISEHPKLFNSRRVNLLFYQIPNASVNDLSSGPQQPQLTLTSLGQPGYLMKCLNWLGFWSPAITSNSVKKTTDSVQEGRWLVHNFPSTSNLYENSKLFTHSKLAISRIWAKSRQSSTYSVDRYKTKKGRQFLKLSNSSTTLNEQHFGFFETSRFFADARNYNLTGLTSYVSNLLYITYKSVMGTGKPKTNLRLKSQLTELARPILNEPYIVSNTSGVYGRRRGSKVISAPKLTGRYSKPLSGHTHKGVKPFTATSSDLAFHEFINTTLISAPLNGSTPVIYVNHTIPEPTKVLFKAKSYPVTVKPKKLN